MIKSMIVVESLVSAIIARRHIIKPYTDFPAEPVIIFCGGIANIKNRSNPPTMNIDNEDANTELNLTPMTNINMKITMEFPSIIPGEPAVHLKALIQTTIQSIRKISPGKTKDCCMFNIEKFHVYQSKLIAPTERFVKLMTEKAIMLAEII